MILDIKRKKKEKRIQLLGGLIGICVAVVSLFYFFHAEKTEAEKRMVEIVNYVKVQCSTYTHYNESSESKSLLRAIESARQMSTNIDMEIKNGRYGPYIVFSGKNYKIPKAQADKAAELTLEECRQIIEQEQKKPAKTTRKRTTTRAKKQ